SCARCHQRAGGGSDGVEGDSIIAAPGIFDLPCPEGQMKAERCQAPGGARYRAVYCRGLSPRPSWLTPRTGGSVAPQPTAAPRHGKPMTDARQLTWITLGEFRRP